MDIGTDRQRDKRPAELRTRQTDEQTDERTDEQTDERTDERTDEKTDEKTDKRTDKQTHGPTQQNYFYYTCTRFNIIVCDIAH